MISLDDVLKDGLSLPAILQRLKLVGQPDKYSFFMHSASMQAAVRMPRSEAVHATWQLYCQHDSDDPSPNSSRAPSYSKALSQRRSASGNLTVPDIPIHTHPRKVSARIDPVSMEPTANLPENKKVIILPHEGDAQAVSKNYLLCEFLALCQLS